MRWASQCQKFIVRTGRSDMNETDGNVSSVHPWVLHALPLQRNRKHKMLEHRPDHKLRPTSERWPIKLFFKNEEAYNTLIQSFPVMPQNSLMTTTITGITQILYEL